MPDSERGHLVLVARSGGPAGSSFPYEPGRKWTRCGVDVSGSPATHPPGEGAALTAALGDFRFGITRGCLWGSWRSPGTVTVCTFTPARKPAPKTAPAADREAGPQIFYEDSVFLGLGEEPCTPGALGT